MEGGGILGGTISNCINKADITGYNMVGGIAPNYIKNINNCQNYGTIEITGAAYRICWCWRDRGCYKQWQ